MKAYGPFQQRLVDELDALNEKLQNIYDGIYENPQFSTLPADEQVRLKLQHTYMALYADVLYDRICTFDAADGADDVVTETQQTGQEQYYELIGRVATFDMVAAEKLRAMPDKLMSEGIDFTYTNRLISCFAWSETDDGYNYWSGINYRDNVYLGTRPEEK